MNKHPLTRVPVGESETRRSFRQPGPWDSEDDEVTWLTRSGFKARIIRHPATGFGGVWCAIVKLPDHPLFRDIRSPHDIDKLMLLPDDFREKVGTCRLTWIGHDRFLGHAVGADFGHPGQFVPNGIWPYTGRRYVTQAMAAEACELWAIAALRLVSERGWE